jgi:SNF2 family DNA or RNA helicase
MHQPTWLIEDDVLNLIDGSGQAMTPTANEIFDFVFGDATSVCGVQPLESKEVLSFSRFPVNLTIDVTIEQTGDAIAPSVSVRANRLNISHEIKNFVTRTADHVVIGNVWYPIAMGNMEAIREILIEVGVQRLGAINLREYLALVQLSSSNVYVQHYAKQELSALKISTSSISYKHSPLFKGNLYSYQEDGYKWLRWIAEQELGCILADEMGLGKTIQLIALLAALHRPDAPSLIVAPATLLENWRRELNRFSPDLQTILHQGSMRTGFPKALSKADVVLMSYGTVIRDISLLKMIDWVVVALDEAQAIKNPFTQRTELVKQIPRRVSVAITGTPVENRLTDLWSIIDFAIPKLLGPLQAFESNYSNATDSAAKLEPFISPIILRRTVADAAKDLPARIDIPQILTFTKEEAEGYEHVRQEILATHSANATLVALLKLRMYCSHPFLIDHSTGDPVESSVKYRRLTEILEEILDNGHKVLVFTSFNEMSDIIAVDVKQRFEVYCAQVYGEVPVQKRQLIIDDFSRHNGPALLVLNPRAAGTGLNITAASHVIHYNLEWNPAVEDQATARAFRRGQVNPVTVHRLFYADTVEDVINDRLTRKREIAAMAVVGVDGTDQEHKDITRALNLSPLRGMT